MGERMKGIVQALAVVGGLSAASPAVAVDGYVRNGSLSGWTWTDPQYWTDASGAALGTYPHAAGDTASLACVSNNFRTVVMTPQASLQDMALAKLSGGYMTYVNFVTDTKQAYPGQRLTIDDPDDFAGWWGTQNDMGRAEIVLNATGAYAPRLSALSVTGRNGLTVPAGTSASVGALFGDGALYASGEGTLKIEQTAGADSHLIAPRGTVEIAGVSAADDTEALLKKAAFRVDASRLDTLTFGQKKGDSRQYVVRWNDANGGPDYAYTNKQDYATADKIATWDPPFVAAETSPTGLRLVDFGEMDTDPLHVEGHPVNGWLRLSRRFNAREVFFVSQTVSASGLGGTVAGSVTSATNFRGAMKDTAVTPNVYAAVDYGDIRINDQKTTWANRWPTRRGTDARSLSVTSMAILDDDAETTGDVALIGTFAWGKGVTGNVRVGEFLVYTNQLTASQRSVINRHLMKKWLKGAGDEDFGHALLGNGTTVPAVSVPEGRVAKIAQVTVDGGALVKEGGGTLKIGKLMPLEAALDIRGGSVELGAPKAVADLEPAANPHVWFDADAAGSVVTQKITNVAHYAGDETMYVTRWKDCRADHTSIFAEVPPASTWSQIWTVDYSSKAWFPTNYPKYTSFGNHGVVDFGHASDASNPRLSFMWINYDGTVTGPGAAVETAYDAFIVLRWKAKNASCNYFGSSSADLLRSGYNRILDPVNSSSAAAAGIWCYDGHVMEPWKTGIAELGDADAFHVVSFSCAKKQAPDMLAKDRLRTPNSAGAMMIGEYISYDRPLTREEREQTTAYLLKKWRGEALPGSAADKAPSRDLTVAASIPAEFGVEADMTIANLSGGNGVLVKNGAGTANVVAMDDVANLRSVTVNGGKLVLPRWKGAIGNKMLFNFDATDVGSFETNFVDGTTWITRWFDERDSSPDVCAISVLDGLSLSYIDTVGDKRSLPQRPGQYYRMAAAEHPTLKTVETSDGNPRPVVDFGTYGSKDAQAGAAMDFLKRFTNVAEIHTVMADTDANRRAQIVSDYAGTALMRYPYLNASVNGQLLHATSSAEAARNGYIAVDGEEKRYDYVLPDGFHLVSFAPTAPVSVGNLCNERMFFCGGAQYGQQIAFSSALTPDERAYLEEYLLYKWKGVGANPTLLTLSELTVAEGCEVDFGDHAIEVASVKGSGRITAGAVSEVNALALPGPASPLTVSGSLALARGPCTVSLTDDLTALAEGTYPLVKASSVSLTDFTGLVLDAELLPPNRTAVLKATENAINLVVSPRGLIILVK